MADLVRHPDVVDLAEYVEGVLDTSRQAAVDQHVRECADCAATLADLAGLPETLAQTPVPPLPTDVADRLDRVIAAEVSARASTPVDKPTSNVVPMRARRRWLAPVLAAAAVIGVIGIAVPVLNGSGGSSDESGAAGGSAERFQAGGQAADSERQRPGDKAIAPRAQVEGVPPLSSANFGRDVADTFYSDHAMTLRTGPLGSKPLADVESTLGEGLCPAPANADLSQGRVIAITLDGQPAHLLLEPGRTIDAVAFTCQGSAAQILASASLKAR